MNERSERRRGDRRAPTEPVTHSLERTSPKGQEFVGRCVLCGQQGFGLGGASMPCPNPRGVMADQVVLDAIEGPREPEVDVVAKLERAIQIIEIGDIRLLASDGPAGGQPPDISLDEWREMYVCMTEVVRELIRRWDRTP